ncbi:hypothetical protein ACQEU5_03275 [Marinactinospora thermotolerans]|uniref:LPXTG-motif cell wall anchor domain-containing protein n=1 Tax=Marinactinospora thermotolerans DSM 45154 TaxID=1122192 RepID=A0A1T4LFC5_9ACTN|nr:hypothetical protein [Marinactinospora thermotolerans]SJZ53373.1 hypothetical protein SAMN02745673_00652 [Marinactinospora thermotolerans DSM 45154]
MAFPRVSARRLFQGGAAFAAAGALSVAAALPAQADQNAATALYAYADLAWGMVGPNEDDYAEFYFGEVYSEDGTVTGDRSIARGPLAGAVKGVEGRSTASVVDGLPTASSEMTDFDFELTGKELAELLGESPVAPSPQEREETGDDTGSTPEETPEPEEEPEGGVEPEAAPSVDASSPVAAQFADAHLDQVLIDIEAASVTSTAAFDAKGVGSASVEYTGVRANGQDLSDGPVSQAVTYADGTQTELTFQLLENEEVEEGYANAELVVDILVGEDYIGTVRLANSSAGRLSGGIPATGIVFGGLAAVGLAALGGGGVALYLGRKRKTARDLGDGES